jgi:hypothetical protein
MAKPRGAGVRVFRLCALVSAAEFHAKTIKILRDKRNAPTEILIVIKKYEVFVLHCAKLAE